MLVHDAASFYSATVFLLHLHGAIADKARSATNPDGSIDIVTINDPVFLRFLRANLKDLHRQLVRVGAPVTAIATQDLLDASDDALFTFDKVSRGINEIDVTLKRELTAIQFFVLEPRAKDYFAPPAPLFGAEVQDRFPTDASFEIDEAAKCFALERSTACVFHLMRVLEVGIRAIARCLDIPDPVKPAQRNWALILKAISDKCEQRWPTQADRMSGDGQLFVELRAGLEVVKNAWRDPTMHVEKKYTTDEAEHIFVAVKGLMRRLASRCDENGERKA